MYPFERFNEDAKRTLTLAQEEAERAHHSYIGTEHLLLGLMRVESGNANRVLVKLGISIGPVRETLKAVLGRNERIIIQQIIPTSRVKQVIELSFGEAQRMGHNFVDTGHLLMGLAIEGEGIAAHVLEDLGATLEQVIAAVEQELGVAPSGRTRKDYPDVGPAAGHMPMSFPLTPHDTDAAELIRLLHIPDVVRLLSAKGLDTEALSKQLTMPPQEVVKLRSQLRSISSAMEAAVGAQNRGLMTRLTHEHSLLATELDKAEKAWLRSLE